MASETGKKYSFKWVVFIIVIVATFCMFPDIMRELFRKSREGPYQIELSRFTVNIKGTAKITYLQTTIYLTTKSRKVNDELGYFSRANVNNKQAMIRSEILKILADKDMDFYSQGATAINKLSSEIKDKVNSLLGKNAIEDVYIVRFLIQ